MRRKEYLLNVQLEDLRRERDGGLSHRDRPSQHAEPPEGQADAKRSPPTANTALYSRSTRAVAPCSRAMWASPKWPICRAWRRRGAGIRCSIPARCSAAPMIACGGSSCIRWGRRRPGSSSAPASRAAPRRAPDFEEVVQRYYKRWDISIPEDNAHLRTAAARPRIALRPAGPAAHAEPLVHTFGNWVLDHVLGVRA